MKKSHLTALAIVFLGLVVLWYYEQMPEKTNVKGLYVSVSKDFDRDSIKSIEAIVLSHPEERLELVRQKGGWKVRLTKKGQRFWARAKKTKVERLLSLLAGLQGEPRAKGKKYLSTFGLDKGEGLKITLKNGSKEVLTVTVGSKGPDWGSSFLRVGSSDTVYLVSRDILSVFDIWSKRPEKGLDLEPWVDLDVLSVFPSGIKMCSLDAGEKSWSLSRITKDGKAKGNPDTWRFKKGGQVTEKTSKQVMEYLSKLIPLRAKDVVPPSEGEKWGGRGSNKTPESFSCLLKSGPLRQVEIGGCLKGSKRCLVKANGFAYEVDYSWVQDVENPFEKEKKVDATGSKKTGKSVKKD